jgi:hypothetical protein
MYKIGMTERSPEDRVRELFTTGVPTPFKIQFAKKVSNPKQKEASLHILLAKYGERIYPKREFFRIPLEEVKLLFDLMDGEEWCETGEEVKPPTIHEFVLQPNEESWRLEKTKSYEPLQHLFGSICRVYIEKKDIWIYFKLTEETQTTFGGFRLQQNETDKTRFVLTQDKNKWSPHTDGAFSKQRWIYVYNQIL